MLEKIKFSNFKSWEEVDLTCGNITGLFGTNSSGKTSLIQFILLLKQTKDATDRAISLELNGDLVKLGTYKDLIHKHDETRKLDIEISFKLPGALVINDPSEKSTTTIARSDRLKLSSQIQNKKNIPSSQFLSYQVGDMEFKLSPKNDDQSHFQLLANNSGTSKKPFSFIRTQGRAWNLPGPTKTYGFPDQARTYYQNAGFLADIEKELETALDNIYYLGPLREFPQRDYLWARSRPTDVGKKGEKTIDAILAASEAPEKRNIRHGAKLRHFQEIVAHFLKEMGLIENFSVEEIYEGTNRWQARVTTRRGASQVLLTDVGFGVSQVLPVVTLLQYVPEGSIVILEQPEIHLHPLAQAGLADVIIQAATHRKIQVILESHSEHLLLRLQRRIAEEKICADMVKLYFCDAPDGKSKITPLEIDEYGQINNWPQHFMGDAFGETAEAELARIKRLKEVND